jgi:hypothetical protein
MKYLILFLLPVLFIASGCRGEGVIEEDKFVEVYADILIAGDTVSVGEAKKIVFPRYNISESDYRSTVEYYNSNPEEWENFFNKVIAHIEERRKTASSAPEPSPGQYE